jgi:hypothetical protein
MRISTSCSGRCCRVATKLDRFPSPIGRRWRVAPDEGMEIPRPSNFRYKLTTHSLIRPTGTFSQWEKGAKSYFCCARICASTAAIAVMFTTRRGVAELVRICTGLEMPIRIGPMATPSVITRTML